jgi:hypothetical protein
MLCSLKTREFTMPRFRFKMRWHFVSIVEKFHVLTGPESITRFGPVNTVSAVFRFDWQSPTLPARQKGVSREQNSNGTQGLCLVFQTIGGG